MKKEKQIKPYMIRPIIQKTVTRILCVLVACLFWDRFLNKDHIYSIFELPLLLAGVILLAAAWFCYLRLDDMRVHYLGEDDKPKRQTKKHHERSVVDFVDEKVVAYEELEPQEQTVCGLVSNLIPGLLSVLIAIIYSLR